MTGQLLTSEQLYDSIGPAYEKAWFGVQPQLDAIQWVLQQVTGKKAKILDMGCGTGRPVCSAFADAGHDVLGIDVSGVMIEHARTSVPNCQFTKANQYEIELPSGSFDAVTAFFALVPGSTPDLIRKQITRVHDWLKPGGIFILSTAPAAADQVQVEFMGRKFIGSSLSREEYLSRLEREGFDVVYHSMSKFKPMAVEAGICGPEDVVVENHFFLYAKKK